MHLTRDVEKWVFQIIGTHELQPNQYLLALKPAELIVQLLQQAGLPVPPTFKSLKTTNSSGSRLYNWNILTDSLKKLQIQFSSQIKNSIVAGEVDAVVSLVQAVYDKFSRISKPNSQSKVQSSKSVQQTLVNYCLDALIKYLEISKQQAVSLLSQNCKYLAHILIKGVKNQFQPVQNLLLFLLQDIPNLLQRADSQEKQQFLIQMIKLGILSKDVAVAQLSFAFITNLVQQASKLGTAGEAWLYDKPVSLLTEMILAIRRHSSMSGYVSTLILLLSSKRLQRLVKAVEQSSGESSQFIKFFKNIYNLIKEDLEEEGKQYLFSKLIKGIKNSKNLDQYILLLELVADGIGQFDSWPDQLLVFLGSAQVCQKITVAQKVSECLQETAMARSPRSAQFYRMLVKFLQKANSQQEFRHFLLLNFENVFKNIPSIPPEPFVRAVLPFIKKGDSEDINPQFTTIQSCLHNSRIKPATVKQILQGIFSHFLNSKIWRLTSQTILFSQLKQKKDMPQLQQFMVTSLKLSLAVLLTPPSKKEDKYLSVRRQSIFRYITLIAPFFKEGQKARQLILTANSQASKLNPKTGRKLIQIMGLLPKKNDVQSQRIALQSQERQQPKQRYEMKSNDLNRGGILPSINSTLPFKSKAKQIQDKRRVNRSVIESTLALEADKRVLDHLKKLRLQSQYKALNSQQQKSKIQLIEKKKLEKVKEEASLIRVVVGSCKAKDLSYQPIFQFDKGFTIAQAYQPYPPELIEQRDSEVLVHVNKKYSGGLRLVFGTQARMQKKDKKDSKEEEDIDFMRFFTFLKQFTSNTNKQEISQIYKFASGSLSNKMNFQQFEKAINQVALLLCNKESTGHLIEFYEEYLKRMFQIFQIKFEQNISDKQKELTKKLVENAEMQLPRNYVKVSYKEYKSVNHFGEFPESSNYFMCLQVLADMLQPVLGRLVMQPRLSSYQLTRVRKRAREESPIRKQGNQENKEEKQQQQLKQENKQKKPYFILKAELKKETVEKMEKQREKQKKQEILRRKNQIAKELNQLKESKQVQQAKLKQQKRAKQQKEKVRRQKNQEQQQRTKEQNKKKIKEFKERQQHEKSQQQKKKEEQLKKVKKEADQNLKKQKEKHSKDIEDAKILAKQKQDTQKKKAEESKLKEEKFRKEAANKLQKLKEKVKLQKQAKEKLKGLIKQSQFREVFDLYQAQLTSLFQSYIKRQQFKLDKSPTNLSYKFFIKIISEAKITPNLISISDLSSLFKRVSVEEDKVEGLSYHEFQLILLKIAAKAQAQLQGEKQSKQQSDQLHLLQSLQKETLIKLLQKLPFNSKRDSPPKRQKRGKKGSQPRVEQLSPEGEQKQIQQEEPQGQDIIQ